MPTTPTYPGVYIEEIPSGVRTITGVGTSITAFVGRALRGPANVATVINSFGDFERIFGGLWLDSTMSFAVRDFYLNGGSQAVIVRLDNGGAAATISLLTGGASPDDDLPLVAYSSGTWGNNLSIEVDYDTRDSDQTSPPPDTDLFNLTIMETGGATEKFLNVSVNPDDPRYVANVLANNSVLVAVDQDTQGDFIVPNIRPQAGVTAAAANSGTNGAALTFTEFLGSETDKEGIYALENADLFNLLCLPPFEPGGDMSADVVAAAGAYCERRRAMLLVDPLADWDRVSDVTNAGTGVSSVGTSSKNSALYFPRLVQPNPLRENQLETFVPCGAIAGVMARTDSSRGVWKAPAGLDATLVGVPALSVPLTDAENGQLNPLGVNCLRTMPAVGRVVWGARTLQGNDRLGSEWKYVPVRRTALFLEESLYRGTQWVVFEPNDEPLWGQIRLNIGAFMQNLFRQGAFQGKSPKEAYFVKCDKETTTQNDINLGIVNIIVGFAPLKPAEFVIIKFQQMAGQIEV